mmetsp:Transcript_57685/g.137225  ORF Transcript_57685/g.137225 Transcript_57685/m.137225 type:complete len:375 (-) Transcript_57685:43-1167(-)
MTTVEKKDGPQTARIAVAGAGWWGQGFTIPHLSRNALATLTAIIEPCPNPRSTLKDDMKSTKELSETYNVPVFKTVDEFLASDAGKNTDGMVVATNHATHNEVGIKAMKSGYHVLMEKPMTTDVQEARELMEEAARTERIFMVNNTANYRDHAKTAHDLVRGGEIGKVQYVACAMASALGWLFEDERNVGWTKPSGKMLGNGFAWGQLSHTLAWVYLVTDLEPEFVICHMGWSEKTGADLHDSAIVKCKGGAFINVQGVGNLPFVSYEKTTKQIENRIVGSEGTLLYSGEDMFPESGKLVVTRSDGKEQVFPGFYFEEYQAEGDGPNALKSFIGGILGKPFFNGAPAKVGYRAVQTIEGMYRSALSGKQEAVAV